MSFKWTWENEVKTQIFDSELVWTRNCFELLLLPTKHLNLNLLNIFCYVCRDGNADSTSSPLPNFFTLFLPSFTWDGCSVCLPFLSLPPPSLSFFIFLFQVSVLFTSSFLSRHSLPPFLSACQLLFKKFNHCLGCLQSILSFCLSAIHYVLFALLHCFYCFISNFQSCPKMLFVPRILIKLFVSLEKNCFSYLWYELIQDYIFTFSTFFLFELP